MAHERRRTRFPVLRLLAGLVVALLLGSLLAACGGEEDDDGEGPVNHFDQSELSEGQEAPDFTLPTTDGTLVSLDDYTGADQPVMLFFHMAGG